MELSWPNGSKTEPNMTGAYGPRDPIWASGGWTRPYHVGVDHTGIGKVRTIGNGDVWEVTYLGWAGWNVLVFMGAIDGVNTWVRYCHLSADIQVKEGQQVERGTVLGYESDTGQVTGVHLHWEVYRGKVDRGAGANPGSTTDPRAFVRKYLNPPSKPSGGGGSEPIIEEEEDDMTKNSGVYYRKGRNTYVYLVFNTGSGFFHEFGQGPEAGTMPGNYTADLKKSFDFPHWSEVTEGHAAVIKAGLVAVQPKASVIQAPAVTKVDGQYTPTTA